MIWLKVWQFIKPLAPYLLAALAVIAAYGFIYNKGYNAGKDDGYSKSITETKKIVSKLPDCNCPEQKPCQGIDFDKIKSRAVTIENHQHITTSGDSLLIPKIRKVFKEEMEEAKLVRCKR